MEFKKINSRLPSLKRENNLKLDDDGENVGERESRSGGHGIRHGTHEVEEINGGEIGLRKARSDAEGFLSKFHVDKIDEKGNLIIVL